MCNSRIPFSILGDLNVVNGEGYLSAARALVLARNLIIFLLYKLSQNHNDGREATWINS